MLTKFTDQFYLDVSKIIFICKREGEFKIHLENEITLNIDMKDAPTFFLKLDELLEK